MTPVPGLIVNPFGKPVADHVKGASPLATTGPLYAIFTAPFGNEVVLITSGVTVSITVTEVDAVPTPPLESVTLKVTVWVPTPRIVLTES